MDVRRATTAVIMALDHYHHASEGPLNGLVSGRRGARRPRTPGGLRGKGCRSPRRPREAYRTPGRITSTCERPRSGHRQAVRSSASVRTPETGRGPSPLVSSGASPAGQMRICGTDELACKPDPVPGCLAAVPFGGHPSRPAVAGGLQRPTRRLGRAALERLRRHRERCPLGLAPGGVYRATPVTRGAGGLLHHRFTLTPLARGGLFSVALSRGSPRVAVGNHPALRSPDFPRQRGACPHEPTLTRPPGQLVRVGQHSEPITYDHAQASAGAGRDCR